MSNDENNHDFEASPNPDNEWLDPVQVGPFTIDYDEDIHGVGGKAVADYEPTKHELSIVALHWIRELLEIDIFWFLHRTTGSQESRMRGYASRRLGRIADAIGEDAVNEIVLQEEGIARRRLGDRYWYIFKQGTPEEWDQVEHEVLGQMDKSEDVPGYTISDLTRLAVARFPEIPGASLAEAMRMAADQVEKGEVESPSCDHSWEEHGEKYCSTSWMERCPKCDALRQRKVPRSLDNSPQFSPPF
jgi:hypothetical protein